MGCYATDMPVMSSGCQGPRFFMAIGVLLSERVTVVKEVTFCPVLWITVCLLSVHSVRQSSRRDCWIKGELVRGFILNESSGVNFISSHSQ